MAGVLHFRPHVALEKVVVDRRGQVFTCAMLKSRKELKENCNCHHIMKESVDGCGWRWWRSDWQFMHPCFESHQRCLTPLLYLSEKCLVLPVILEDGQNLAFQYHFLYSYLNFPDSYYFALLSWYIFLFKGGTLYQFSVFSENISQM